MMVNRWRRLSMIALIGLASLVAPVRSPATAQSLPLLGVTSFHEVAQQGFGDYQNSWPWASAWYKGRVYIGTTRNVVCSTAVMTTPPTPDPDLHCPPTLQALAPTLGAQIWSVDPSSASVLTQTNWTENYASALTVPITLGTTSVWGPRDIGFRGMSVFTETDGTPSLYVSGVSSKGIAGPSAPPPSLLRSTDGVAFQAVPADPGTTMGNINVLTTTSVNTCCLRGQATYGGFFYILVTNGAGAGTVFASATPQAGNNSFKQITPPRMAVYEVQAFNNHLYLGVASHSGYSVWRTDCTAPPPGQVSCPLSDFTQIIPDGAGVTQNPNVSVTSMHVFTDTAGMAHLYIGAASSVSIHPAPAELARVNQDDSWDLIVGATRTVGGVQMVPLSGLGPGFGWPFNLHMWRMTDYQGNLFVGTYDSSTSYFKGTAQQAQYQAQLGFDLFATADGLHFAPVTLNGFGDMFNEGVRALVSTPYGLFVGAANHWYGLRMYQGLAPRRAAAFAAPTLQAVLTPRGQVAMSWPAAGHGARFHVYRSEARRDPAMLSLETNHMGAVPGWGQLPTPYHEIGVSFAPSYVDRTLPVGSHATYYIATEDSMGRLSAPSTLATVPYGPSTPSLQGARAAEKATQRRIILSGRR